MNNRLHMSLVFSALFVSGSCGESPPAPAEEPAETTVIEDIVAEAPQNASLLLDNPYVSAVEFTLQPGEALHLHQGGPRLAYSLSDYDLKFTTETGEVTEKKWVAGDVHWHEAVSHAVENVGSSDALYLVVTRTEEELPEAGEYSLENDVNAVSPESSEILFENDRIRVTRVSIEAGASIPSHDGIYRLIYSLTNYKLAYESDQEGSVEKEFQMGDLHWHAPSRHSLSNSGDSEARYVIFAWKR
jgi:quercetin dioxygenase-like cupin family protein